MTGRPCPCGDGACVLCDDRGMRPVVDADVLRYADAEHLRAATVEDLRRALACDPHTGTFLDEDGVAVYLEGVEFDGRAYSIPNERTDR